MKNAYATIVQRVVVHFVGVTLEMFISQIIMEVKGTVTREATKRCVLGNSGRLASWDNNKSTWMSCRITLYSSAGSDKEQWDNTLQDESDLGTVEEKGVQNIFLGQKLGYNKN